MAEVFSATYTSDEFPVLHRLQLLAPNGFPALIQVLKQFLPPATSSADEEIHLKFFRQRLSKQRKKAGKPPLEFGECPKPKGCGSGKATTTLVEVTAMNEILDHLKIQRSNLSHTQALILKEIEECIKVRFGIIN